MNYSAQQSSRIHVSGYTLMELLIGLAIVAIVASIAYPMYSAQIDRSRNATAVSDIAEISFAVERFFTINFRYPDSLVEINEGDREDPWGNAYEYLNIGAQKGKGKLRKNRNLVPINSDFDLYSKGKDGRSVSPLTAKPSRDDIVRASNGSFVGLAADY